MRRHLCSTSQPRCHGYPALTGKLIKRSEHSGQQKVGRHSARRANWGQLEDGTATSARRPRRSGRMLEELTAVKESKLYQQTNAEAMRTRRATLGAMPVSILGAMLSGCRELRRWNRFRNGDLRLRKHQHRHQQLQQDTISSAPPAVATRNESPQRKRGRSEKHRSPSRKAQTREARSVKSSADRRAHPGSQWMWRGDGSKGHVVPGGSMGDLIARGEALERGLEDLRKT